MWDIPLSLNHWPNQHPGIYHVQSFYKPWAKLPTHHKPRPRVRMSILALGRKQKKRKRSSRSKIERKKTKKKVSDRRFEERKRKFSIKDWKKAKKKGKFPIEDRKKTKEMYIKVFRLDNIWTIQNCHQINKKKRERKPWPKVVLSLWLPTKILCASDFLTPH